MTVFIWQHRRAHKAGGRVPAGLPSSSWRFVTGVFTFEMRWKFLVSGGGHIILALEQTSLIFLGKSASLGSLLHKCKGTRASQ